MKPLTQRRIWTPFCDNYHGAYDVASWYDSDIHRLRVGYWVRQGIARLMVVLPSGAWRVLETRNWNMPPEHAEVAARKWLAEEAARRWPTHEPHTADVDVLKGNRWRRVGKLRTVKK